MQAIQYHKVEDWSLITKPVPVPKAHEALIKGAYIPSVGDEQTNDQSININTLM